MPERIPFIWDGTNYLLKIAADVDFLDTVRPLRRVLGYPLLRNPFITPFSLDQLPPDPGPPAPLLPLTAGTSLTHLREAGGGRAIDSVRIFRASVAILEEEAAFRWGDGEPGTGVQGGSGALQPNASLMPDWSRDRDASNTHESRRAQAASLGGSLQQNIRDTKAILRMGLGIETDGTDVGGDGAQRKPADIAAEGRRHLSRRQGGTQDSRAITRTSSVGPGSKLHPADYIAVKRKTGISRSDITALVVYSVPPAGVKLALEALRTMLHPACDPRVGAKGGAKPGLLPRAIDLEWSSLRRMAMNREHLLRCMLRVQEATPMRPVEKYNAMLGYLNDPTFDPDVVVRQSESAALVIRWMRRVVLSAMRAQKRGDFGVEASHGRADMASEAGTHPHVRNTWGGGADADDEQDGDEDDTGLHTVGGGQRDGFKRLHAEISRLRDSLRDRGVLSDEEGDEEYGDGQISMEQAKTRAKRWRKRRRLRSRGSSRGSSRGVFKTGQRTLLRTSRRLPCDDVPVASAATGADDTEEKQTSSASEVVSTVYVVITIAMRYSDGWLVVAAHEPGGVQGCRVQLHPTYFARLVGLTPQQLSELPAGESRDQRLEPVLRCLRASHSFPTATATMNYEMSVSQARQGRAARSSGRVSHAQLLLRFVFPRAIFNGVRRIPVRTGQLSASTTGEVPQHHTYLGIRVEFIDGSAEARTVPWSQPLTVPASSGEMVTNDGGVVVIAWVQAQTVSLAGGVGQRPYSREPFVMVIPAAELSLLFAHKDHLLQQGDIRSQEELTRAIVDQLYLCPAGSTLKATKSAAGDSLEMVPAQQKINGIPMKLEIDRGVPLALMQQEILTLPHMPLPVAKESTSGDETAPVPPREHTRARVSGWVEPGGKAIVFGVHPMENSSKFRSDSPDARPQAQRLVLTVSEVAALSAVNAAQTLRLPPALGRVLDRIYFDTVEKQFAVDKSLAMIQCRISDEMLSVKAEISARGLMFHVQRADEQGVVLPDASTLSKNISWDDARRLLERTGERDMHDLLKPAQSAALAERICNMLRLVEKDGTGLSVGQGAGDLSEAQRNRPLAKYRLETAMFRRMVNVMVAIEAAPEGGDSAGPADTLPVGSISIDDSATLAQAREELERQLGGHVDLPENFRFTWRGRPFNRAQEHDRTIAECLPSLQVRVLFFVFFPYVLLPLYNLFTHKTIPRKIFPRFSYRPTAAPHIRQGCQACRCTLPISAVFHGGHASGRHS